MFSAVNTELAVKSSQLGGTQRLENKCTARLGAGRSLCSVAKLWQQGCAPPSLRETPMAGPVTVSSPSTCPTGGCAAPAGSALQDELFGSSGSVRCLECSWSSQVHGGMQVFPKAEPCSWEVGLCGRSSENGRWICDGVNMFYI